MPKSGYLDWMRSLSFNLLVVLLAMSNQRVVAYAWSWSTLSEDEQFLFVSLCPTSLEEQLKEINQCGWQDEAERVSTIAETRHLEANYSSTGVYRNDGSTQPLWVVNQYVWNGQLSPDGSRVVAIDNHHLFSVMVCDKAGIREFYDLEIEGVFSFLCHRASGNDIPWVEGSHFNPNDASWSNLNILWENGAKATVCLDDLSVVRSNVNYYAIRAMTSTPQGIAILIGMLSLAAFIGWGVLQFAFRAKYKRSTT